MRGILYVVLVRLCRLLIKGVSLYIHAKNETALWPYLIQNALYISLGHVTYCDYVKGPDNI